MQAGKCTHAVCIATATTGAETYKLQLQQLALRHTRCIDMSLDCPYLCFAHDFTSIALVSVWICIAPWSSLKDQDLEPKTKRWLLLKRQVQEEARIWGVVTAFFTVWGGDDLLDWKFDEPIAYCATCFSIMKFPFVLLRLRGKNPCSPIGVWSLLADLTTVGCCFWIYQGVLGPLG